MRREFVLLAVVAALVLGCAKGKDGEDGDAYGYITSATGIDAIDFSEIGVVGDALGLVYFNTRYKLISGVHTIGVLIGSTWYLADVEIEVEKGEKGKAASTPLAKAEDGKDGRDHLYYADIYYDTLYWDDAWVDHGDAPATLALMSTNGEALDGALAIPSVPMED